MKRSIWIILIGLFLAGCTNDVTSIHVLLDNTYTLPEDSPDHTVVVMLDGYTTLIPEHRYEGSTFILSGEYHLAGTYNGNLTIFSGIVTIADSAIVEGIINIAGGQVDISPDATILATIQEGDVQIPRATLSTGNMLVDQILWFFIQTIPLILLALIVRQWWWQPFTTIETALTDHAVVSAAMGILVGMVALVLIVVMAFTLILLPIAMLGLLILLIAIAIGIIATSHILVSILYRRIGIQIDERLLLILGVILIMLLLNLIESVPFSSVVTAPLLTIGLGAVALTRGGLRPFVAAYESEISKIA